MDAGDGRELAGLDANRAFESGLADSVTFEGLVYYRLFATADEKEGMEAFVNKHMPVLTQR